MSCNYICLLRTCPKKPTACGQPYRNGRDFVMSSVNTILISNYRGGDGVFAFDRQILFSPAISWVVGALPRDRCGEIYLLGAQGAHTPAGVNFYNWSEENAYSLMTCGSAEHVLLISAPIPELTAEDYSALIDAHLKANSDVTVLCCDTNGGMHTIMRDSDGSPCSIGPGGNSRALHVAVIRREFLSVALKKPCHHLFDTINRACEAGAFLSMHRIRQVHEVFGGQEAWEAQKQLQMRINFELISQGINVMSPENTFVANDVKIGGGTVLLPGTIIKDGCRIGRNCQIGPNTMLDNASVGDFTTINSSQMTDSSVGMHAAIGPFAYIRPGCTIGDNTRIGDFVELKKAEIGNGTKVSHLTYIGDATVGARVNFGCGTVVVNYDGYVKEHTEIGDDCFIGCNTNLVAPVKLGPRAFTAAGATVTRDVPAGALAVSRVRQENKEGWNDRRRKAHQK